MLKASIYLITFVFLINIVNAITFNEVNYNPIGNDNNKEYAELFSQESINLSNYTIEDLSSSDTLTLLKSSNSNYYLIVEEGFDYSLIDANIYSAGPAIGNNLNNDNDQIILKDENGTIIDTFAYNSNMGANNNGKSLCKIPNSTEWFECNPTPGLINQEIEEQNNQQNQSNNELNNETNQSNNQPIIEIPKIIINEILPNPIGDDSGIPNGEWIELYNQGDSLNVNGLTLKDSSSKTIEINSETTQSTIIGKNSYLVVYTGSKIGFLNNDKETEISLYKNDTKIDSVSYENAKEGISFSRIQNKIIPTQPTPNQPNSEVSSEEIQPIDELVKSYIKILDIKENGNFLDITLEISKSNTNKEVIEIYAESEDKKVSNTAKVNVPSKNTNLTLNVPLILKENIKDNIIKIIAEGLDTKDSLEITLKENNNLLNEKTVSEEEDSKIYLKEVAQTTSKDFNTENSNQIYKSKRLKSRDYALYLFIIALVVIVIALVYKNDKI